METQTYTFTDLTKEENKEEENKENKERRKERKRNKKKSRKSVRCGKFLPRCSCVCIYKCYNLLCEFQKEFFLPSPLRGILLFAARFLFPPVAAIDPLRVLSFKEEMASSCISAVLCKVNRRGSDNSSASMTTSLLRIHRE